MKLIDETEKLCPHCGRRNGPQANFCGGCRQKLSSPVKTTVAPPRNTSLPSVAPTTGGVLHRQPNASTPARQSKNNRYLPTRAAGWLALAGAGGGWLGHFLSGVFLGPFFNTGLGTATSLLEVLTEQSLMGMIDCIGIASLVLITGNLQSLRGAWGRDLGRGLALFAALGLVAGFSGQLLFSLMGGSRAIPWALSGVVVGLAIGILRRDKTQAAQGAIGGAIGGIMGGLLVDAFLAYSYTDATFAFASSVGLVITGALIGLFMRLVQDSMKNAWIVGVTPGFYENKEYPLNNARVTVGKSELHDISLYQESELPMQTGAFVQNGANWIWEGEPVEINGVSQTSAPLTSGDTLRLGNTEFRFFLRDED